MNETSNNNETLNLIAKDVYEEISKLPIDAEFTIQYFLKNYSIDEKDKFYLCKEIFSLCSINKVEIIEKMPNADLGLPWNIPRIRK